MSAVAKPALSPFQAACVAGGLISLGLLSFAWNELPRVLRANVPLQIALTVSLAALSFWGAWRPVTIGARWTKFWAAPRNREIVDASSRYLCVFYGPLLVGLFYAMWGVGRLVLGYWPAPLHPDPKSVTATAIIELLIYAWLWLAPLAVVLPGVRLAIAIRRRDGGAVARGGEMTAMWLFAGAALWFLSLDLHGVLSWFKD